jgi:DNA-binding transcriptional ArsR family regulator
MEAGTDIRDALNHPLRRDLLRALATNPEGRSLTELALEFPRAGVSVISYHLRFLNRCGMASSGAAAWKNGSTTWRYGCDFARP